MIKKRVHLFTPGPVNMSYKIRKSGHRQLNYFRNPSFSEELRNLESLLLKVLYFPKDYKIIFLSGSGTASMEMSLNSLRATSNLLSIESGLFGLRATEISKKICNQVDRIILDLNYSISENLINNSLLQKKHDFVHITLSDTSTGYLLNLKEFKEILGYDAFLIADGVTAVFTENIDFALLDAVYFASHKGLGCEPGLSFVAVSPRLQEFISNNDENGYYLNPKIYLTNMERYQPPFTPSLGILNQVKKRVQLINSNGGLGTHIKNVNSRATSFRNFISQYSCELSTPHLSNCVTAFRPPKKMDSKTLVNKLIERNIFITPNSPYCMPDFVRVSHFGDQSKRDYNLLYKNLRRLFNE